MLTSEEIVLTNKLITDSRIQSAQDCCYILATIKHETANTFKPIAEYGLGAGHSYGQPDPATGQTYYGRGYVQLTWKANYEKFGLLLGIDLLNNPDLAMDPDTAYDIITVGMLNGLFTGKKLADYITDTNVDYFNARRIINGLDKAQVIASYATGYDASKTFG